MSNKKPVKNPPSKPVADSIPVDVDSDALTMEDLEKVSGGVYTPGAPRPPVPPPSHRAE